MNALRNLRSVRAVGWLAVAALGDEVQEPPVAAVNDRAITLRDLAGLALEEHRDAELGKEALEQAIDEALARNEADRRGLTVSDGEVAARLKRLEEDIRTASGNRETLADHLKRQGMSGARFRELLRQAIACERMIRTDFGLRDGDPIPAEKQEVWFHQQRLRSQVELTGLPPGVAARVDGSEVRDVDWGQKIYESLTGAEKDRVLDDCILVVLLEEEAERLGLRITPADVEEELRLTDQELAGKLSSQGLAVEGVTFRSILEARGGSIEEHVKSSRFRANLLQRLIAEKRFGGDGYRAFYEDNAALFARRFGRKVHAFLLFLRAGDARTADVPRTWSEAEEELAGLASRIAPPDLEAGFTRLARVYSEHSSRVRGGDLGFVTAADLEPFLDSPSGVTEAPLDSVRGPLRAREGMALFLITERREAQSLEEVQGAVVEEARRQVTRSLQEAAHIRR